MTQENPDFNTPEIQEAAHTLWAGIQEPIGGFILEYGLDKPSDEALIRVSDYRTGLHATFDSQGMLTDVHLDSRSYGDIRTQERDEYAEDFDAHYPEDGTGELELTGRGFEAFVHEEVDSDKDIDPNDITDIPALNAEEVPLYGKAAANAIHSLVSPNGSDYFVTEKSGDFSVDRSN